MTTSGKRSPSAGALVAVAALLGCAGPLASSSEPVVDDSATSQALRKLPRPAGDRVPVTIHEFTSETPDINVRLATDMFTTALVKSGHFMVVERGRLGQGVTKERQKHAAGETTGEASSHQLQGARYVFEAVLTEVSPSAKTDRTSVALAGAELARATNQDVIGIDVRIIDVHTGEVLDSVNVRKAIASSSHGVSGVGSLATTLAGNKLGGTRQQLVPNVSSEGSRKESVDQSLRACIETAVLEIAKRFQP